MYDNLFAPPWYFLAAAFVAGLALLFYALRTGVVPQRKAALGILAAALLWTALDYAVTTPSEVATKGTKQFVHAVVARDLPTLRSLLSPNASLIQLGREDIATMLPQYADEWGLKSATITDTQIEERGPEVLATVHIFSRHESQKLPALDTLPSDWQFIWINEQGTWKITQITPLKIATADLSDITNKYFNGHKK